MDASLLTLATACESIAARALSAAAELDMLADRVPAAVSAPEFQQITLASTGLAHFRQAVVQLRQSISAASVVSENLRAVVAQAIESCDDATAKMSKQVMRLGPDNFSQLAVSVVEGYRDLLTAQTQQFIFLSQVLPMGHARTQDAYLNSSKGQELTEKINRAYSSGAHTRDILLDGAGGTAPAPSGIEQETAPPAYEPGNATASGSSLASTAQPAKESSSGFAKGLSSAFKAMTSSLRAKPEPFVSPLCRAATHGDIAQIQGFLVQGVNINGRNEEGNTALICAIFASQEEAVRCLLSGGADPSVKDSSSGKMPPLFHAAVGGQLAIAQLLVNRGANILETSWTGQPYFVDVVAADRASIEGVRFLLEHGANANTIGISGRSVFAHALRKGDIELARLLLQHGAAIHGYDITGQSYISLVAGHENRLALVDMLLSKGADPNSRTLTGQTILIDSIHNNRLDLVRLLLDRSADANSLDLYGQTALVMVVKDSKLSDETKIEVAEMLLAHGAHADVIDSWGVKLLCYAISNNASTPLIAALLRHGAKANATITNGLEETTLVLYAMDRRRPDVVELLLRSGANPNTADKKGRTPLLEALRTKNADLVRQLRRHDADISQQGLISPADIARVAEDAALLAALRLEPGSSSSSASTLAPAAPRVARPTRAPRDTPGEDEEAARVADGFGPEPPPAYEVSSQK